MDCVKADGLFNSYIDNTLSAAARRELEAHLLACPDCAAELASLQALSASLRALPQPELSPGFSQALHERLTAEPAPPRPALWQRGWAKGVAAAACLLLVISAVAVGGNLLNNKRYNGDFVFSGGGTAPAPMAAPSAPAPAMMNESAMMKSFEGEAQDSATYWSAAPEEELALAEPGSDYEFGSDANGLADSGAATGSGEALRLAGGDEKQLERKIIRDANLSLRVEDFGRAYHSLTELAGRYGGYVVSSDASGYDGGYMQRGYITLRVDAARLDEALAEIDGLGRVENQSFYTQDITMAYYDIAGRLEQYKAQEQRLLEILRKAETVEDLIQLEGELTRVRAELESLNGQLRYYDQMTALSSISVNLYQPDDNTQTVRLSGWAGFMQEIREGFISGLNGLLRALSALTVGFVRLLPALLLLAVAVLIVVLFFRRRRGR